MCNPSLISSSNPNNLLAAFGVLYIITVFKGAVMTYRFLCPHCHHSIDPLALEIAGSPHAQYRVCPECDEPVVFYVIGAEPIGLPQAAPLLPLVFSSDQLTESCVL